MIAMRTPPWSFATVQKRIESATPGKGWVSIEVDLLSDLLADARELRGLSTLASAVGTARNLTTALDDVMKNAAGLVALLDAAAREGVAP
jgi:energy-converting hydrogenase A subunit M